MNDTDVQATNTDYKPTLHKNYKLVLQIWLVNNNVVPGKHVTLGKIRFWVFSDNNTLLLNIVVEKYYIGKKRIRYRIQKKILWHKLHGSKAAENKLNLFYVPQKKESGTHLERLEGKSFLDELSFKLCGKIIDLSVRLSISRNEQIVSVQSFGFWIDSAPINTKQPQPSNRRTAPTFSCQHME